MSLNVMTTGSGTPLLALHGFSGSARTWSAQRPAWSAAHRVIAPDLLGHGGSEAPTEASRYALEAQAAGLVSLLELLEAIPADVVGYSMGARLALVLALEHPRLVARLILESPSAGIADPATRAERRHADEGLARRIEEEGLGSFVEHWEALSLFDSHAALPDELRHRLRTERLGHDPRGLAASLRGAGQGAMAPLHERLGDIGAPTLVMAGEFDQVGLERARVVTHGIPGARLVTIPGAGHTPHLEQPTRFTSLSTDFLSLQVAPSPH